MLDQSLTELPNPMIHAGTANVDNDCLYYGQATKANDRNNFRKAMSVKLKAHIDRGHWVKMPHKDLPKNVKPIKMVWSFKCKHRPDGSLLKHKVCLSIHRGMQEKGINFWETYSPVVRWSTIQLVLTLSITEDLWAWQIDFILAYPQDDIETEIYLDLPIGYEEFLAPNERRDDCILLLKKNVYGLNQAGRTWFQHLRSRLVDLGFTQNKHDHCMFSNWQTVIIVYVDDCLIWGKDKDEIIKVVEQLSREFALTDEGEDIHSYLGIQLGRTIDNLEVHISQPFLIQRIVQFLGYNKDEAKVNKRPPTCNK
jgi:Reverse transcriptase (RNA-dependent DNA polymerase)